MNVLCGACDTGRDTGAVESRCFRMISRTEGRRLLAGQEGFRVIPTAVQCVQAREISSPPSDTQFPQVSGLCFAPQTARHANVVLEAPKSCSGLLDQRGDKVSCALLVTRHDVPEHHQRDGHGGVAERPGAPHPITRRRPPLARLRRSRRARNQRSRPSSTTTCTCTPRPPPRRQC